MSWASDKLVKSLLGKESEGEVSVSTILIFVYIQYQYFWIIVPAGVFLFCEVIVDIGDQDWSCLEHFEGELAQVPLFSDWLVEVVKGRHLV